MSLEPRLDADGIYALLALRSFATSWAPLTDEVEDLGQTNLACGSYDDMLPNTPLCSVIHVIGRETVGILLEHRADPNGYHSRHFDWETQPHEDISPLFTTAMQRRPHLVKMRLQAHADPNECGYEKDLSGEAVSPEGGEHAPRVTPLWQAVEDACDCSPSSPQGRDRRTIVLLLLLYDTNCNTHQDAWRQERQ